MSVKTLTESNLSPYVESGPASEVGSDLDITPLLTGTLLTRQINGSGNLGPTVANISAQLSFNGFFGGAPFLVYATALFQSAPNIPLGATISNVRITFDYTINVSVSSVNPNTAARSEIVGARTKITLYGDGVLANELGNVAAPELLETGVSPANVAFSETDTFEYNSSDTLSPFDYATLVTFFGRPGFLIESFMGGNSNGFGASLGTVAISGTFEISNFLMEVTYEGGDPHNISVTGDASLEIDGTAELDPLSVIGEAELEIDGSADIFTNEFVGGTSLEISGAAFIAGYDITGQASLEIDGSAQLVLSADPSGLYTIVLGKKNDTLYTRTSEDTVDVEIPNPFVKTAFVGG